MTVACLFTLWCLSRLTGCEGRLDRERDDALSYFANDPDRLPSGAGTLRKQGDALMSVFLDNATKKGVMFSGVFTNHTVLQREPYFAAVYGTCDTVNTLISVTLYGHADDDDEVVLHASTLSSPVNGDWKIVFNSTFANGGDYTLRVTCSECQAPPTQQTLYNITFGDVFVCAGQSNMAVEVHWTFSRQATYDAIQKQGRYSNIRLYHKRKLGTTFTPYVVPIDTELVDGKYAWHESRDIARVERFSATCWYFAQSLVDLYNMSHVNIGLIQSAVDGSSIEHWIPNNTVDTHCVANTTKCPDATCGVFYNGMVAPFLNMSVKAWLWYQGENNVYQSMGEEPEEGTEGVAGHILAGTGYACMQNLLVDSWRAAWSANGQPRRSYPFGIVQLAAGTSEGHISAMPYFRWAQTANYGMVPNPHLVDAFIAMAYDVGDPWSTWAADNMLSPAPYDWNSTHWFLGQIHPRPKIFVGQRLARGAAAFVYHRDDTIWQGPVLKSCALDVARGHIAVEFDARLLYGERVSVQPFELWYDTALSAQVTQTSAFDVYVDGVWHTLERSALTVDAGGYMVYVNVSEFAKPIERIRYAWSDRPCCGSLDLSQHPCPMNMCPIVSSTTKLPAIPFEAELVDDQCRCYLPQKCDGDDYPFEQYTTTTTTMMNTQQPQLQPTESIVTTNDLGTELLVTTTFDTDEWPQYICIAVRRLDWLEMAQNSNGGDVDVVYGTFHRIDDKRTVPYWTHNNSEHASDSDSDSDSVHLFFDVMSGYWQIGDMRRTDNNLVCMISMTVQSLQSPLICDDWYDARLNTMRPLQLNASQCELPGDDVGDASDGTQILIQTQTQSNRHWFTMNYTAKITLFCILVEFAFLWLLRFLCRMNAKQRSKLKRITQREQLRSVTDCDDDDEDDGGDDVELQYRFSDATLVDSESDQHQIENVQQNMMALDDSD